MDERRDLFVLPLEEPKEKKEKNVVENINLNFFEFRSSSFYREGLAYLKTWIGRITQQNRLKLKQNVEYVNQMTKVDLALNTLKKKERIEEWEEIHDKLVKMQTQQNMVQEQLSSIELEIQTLQKSYNNTNQNIIQELGLISKSRIEEDCELITKQKLEEVFSNNRKMYIGLT